MDCECEMSEGIKPLTQKQHELFRIAALSALARSNNGKMLTPDARRWAFHWASAKPSESA
jgi:hypothetical protein